MGLKLYLMRHGHSPSPLEAGVRTDFERPLSERGRAAAEKAVRHLLEQGARPALILHSPLLRAVQTAQAAAKVLGPGAPAEMFAPLKNELPPPELAAELRRRCEGVSEVLAVGHQPQLGELVAFLSGKLAELRPAGLAALELDDGGAKLLWWRNTEDLA